MEASDFEVFQKRFCSSDKERYIGGGEFIALGMAATWRIICDITVMFQIRVEMYICQVFFAGPKAMQE
jgi:hypothetical protein